MPPMEPVPVTANKTAKTNHEKQAAIIASAIAFDNGSRSKTELSAISLRDIARILIDMQAKITSLEKSIERHKRSFRSLSEQLEERDTENEELVAELKTCSFILGLFTSNESSGDGIAEQLTVLADRA